ncbi:HAD-like domain-containing protein [Flagelloscypha sp. PMI_526]|nr:HAD-like domain-containing protein [Flagelloscypha sp. PMI_526]
MPFETLIIDFGDVLFDWVPPKDTAIPPKLLRAILNSTTWFDFERGKLTQEDCYTRVASLFQVAVEDIYTTFQQARESLTPNDGFFHLVQSWKQASSGRLRVYALSNISTPDYAYLLALDAQWSIFDEVFVSCEIGERKPHLGIFKHVIERTGSNPATTVFVDDKLDNVLSARSLGCRGVQFTSRIEAFRELKTLFHDPIHRGYTFLLENAGRLESVTDTGEVIPEIFAQLLILEATGQKHLVKTDILQPEQDLTYRFFQGTAQLTSQDFPSDLDTTSLALTILDDINDDERIRVMTKMLDYVNADGIIQTYFDIERPRFDPVVCVNTASLFYRYGRESEVQGTLDFIYNVLLHRAYLHGTRYYTTPECFLFFMSRLLDQGTNPPLYERFASLLAVRIKERVGLPGDPLALAMRLLAGCRFGITNTQDLESLLAVQLDDGSWAPGWVYRYGSSGIQIGNAGLSTAFALKAIRKMRKPTDFMADRKAGLPVSLAVGCIDCWCCVVFVGGCSRVSSSPYLLINRHTDNRVGTIR